MAIAGNQSEAVSRMIVLAELVLVGAICFVLVRAAISFFAPQSVWVNPPITELKEYDYTRRAAPVFTPGFDAFNRDTALQSAPVDIGVDAPETKLNLKLFGIRSSTSGNGSGSAVLQKSDNTQKNYYIDDEVMPGVTLKSISKDFVVLSSSGRLERLSTERGEKTSLIAPSQADDTGTDIIVPQLAALSSGASALNFTVEEFAASHTFNPVLNGNKVAGYELVQTKSGIDLARFGLKSGDVIIKVGDKDLRRGLPDVPAILNDLSSGRVKSFSVLRGGKPVTVKVDSP